MPRENNIRISDREKALLKKVREVEFGTDSVPLGEALETACVDYLGGNQPVDVDV